MIKLSHLVEITTYNYISFWLLAENIRSAYNVGAMFRTADGTNKWGIVLTGYSPTPENPKVSKTGLGAEKNVPWISVEDSVSAVKLLQSMGIPVLGLELASQAKNIFTLNIPNDILKTPLVLCVGNEVEGLSAELMSKVDDFVYIPMNGKKQSLNVAEAASISMYEMYRKLVLNE